MKWERRGAQISPGNRFETSHYEEDIADLPDDELFPGPKNAATIYLEDHSKSILTRNNSPDIGFSYSVNAYRGCEHGCTYCYARPTHEYLGLNAGIDFETKIMVKKNAPQLLQQALRKKSWQKQTIAMSGVTDCYQPAERRFRLTRGCLEVLLEEENPVALITKNVLILRDLDIIKRLAEKNLVQVMMTITTLDEELAKSLEPRTPIPAARLATVHKLANAGVPVGVMMAPVIPGLTDHEIPELLQQVAQAGASSCHYTMLRLPLTVAPVFMDWLKRYAPLRASHVESLITATRGGKLNDSTFGQRMKGEGIYAMQIATTFKVFKKRYGLS